MNEQHLDPELLADLVDSWAEAAMKKQLSGVGYAREITKKTLEWAAPILRQQGADQELEACCEWLHSQSLIGGAVELRAARRPKPPSLKAQARDALGRFFSTAHTHASEMTQMTEDFDLLRRAVEALPE